MLDFLLPRRAAGDPLDGRYWRGGGAKTQAGAVVDENLALTSAACWCASRIICEGESTLPLVTYKRTGDDSRTHGTDHPAYDLLKVRPNDQMGSMAFREGRTLHQVNWGNGFAEIERDLTGRPVNLWPIHPARVKASRPGDRLEGGGAVPPGSYLVRNNDGRSVAVAAQDMLHVPGIFPEDGVWGKGVIAYARECVGFDISSERAGATQFASGNVPRVAIMAQGLKDRGARDNFRREWKEIHGSPDSGEVAILPADAKLQTVSISADQAQFLGTRAFNREQIATWYRVPVHMLISSQGSGHASIEAMGIEFVIYSLYPWCRRWEEQCNLKLFAPWERARYYVEHNFAGLMRGDLAARVSAYQVAITIGVLTINECRRFENLDGIGEAGDRHYVPMNMTTAEAMASGGANPAAAGTGIGSDQSGVRPPRSGSPFDKEEASAILMKRLGRLDRDDLKRRLSAVEESVKAERRAAVLPDLAPMRAAALDVLTETLGRLFVKEARAAERAINGDFDAWLVDFYGKHEALMAGALAPACATMGCAGLKADAAVLAARVCRESKSLLVAAYNGSTKAQFKAMVSAWPTDRAASLAKELCGGPGSGVPGPCPDGGGKDEPQGGGGEPKGPQNVDEKREEEDDAIQAKRDDEDDELRSARDEEDAADIERQQEEDVEIEERRAKEDEELEANRDAEDAEVEARREAEDAEREAVNAARDEEDLATENRRDAEDAADQENRDREDAERDSERQDEDDGREAAREAEDADQEERGADDDERAAVEARRDAEDAAVQERRDKEDAERDAEREDEDAFKDERRAKEDGETGKKRGAEDKAFDARENAREKEDEKVRKAREKEDDAITKQRDREDKAREREQEKKDTEVNRRREKEDKEIERRREKEDRDRERERAKEDRENAA